MFSGCRLVGFCVAGLGLGLVGCGFAVAWFMVFGWFFMASLVFGLFDCLWSRFVRFGFVACCELGLKVCCNC